MKERNILKNPLFRSILISYIAVCAILLLLTGAGYIGSISYVKKEIERSARLRLTQVVTQMENKIQQTYKVCDTLAVGADLEEVGNIQGEFTPQEILSSMDLVSVMNRINLQNNLYDNLHIYFYRSNSLISEKTQRRAGDADMTFFCRQYGLSKAEFEEILSMEGSERWKVLEEGRIWFLRPVYDSAGEKTAMIIAEFYGEKLADVAGEDDVLFVCTDQGVLCCAGNLDQRERQALLETDGNMEEINIQGQRYVVMQQDVGLFGWKCRMAVPNTLFWSEMRRFQLMLVLEVLVLLAVAFLGSLYFSKRTYLPIGVLQKDNRTLSKKVSESQRMLKNMELTRFLSGESQDASNVCRILQDQISLGKEEWQMMAVLHVGEEGKQIFYREQELASEDLNEFVLENILREQIFFWHPGQLIPVGKNFVAILRLKAEEEFGEIRNGFQSVEKFYGNELHIPLRIMLGRPRQGVDGLKEEFEALTEGLWYLDFWGPQDEQKEGVYAYGEIIKTDEHVNFSVYLNGSRRLLNCLESGDFQGAYRELDNIYRESFPRDRKYLKYNMYRMYGLIGILVTTLDTYANEEDQEFFENLHYEERLFRIQSMPELLLESRKLFESIIQYKEQKTKEGEPEWFEELLQYIEVHYQDVNLNVSTLAEIFGISMPHLSRTFKSVMDKGVLEHLHQVRLSHAKEMLKNGGNIKNVAPAVGYADAKALSRAFKRYEGITPTQYKDLISKNGL